MKVVFDGFWWDEGPPSNRSVQRELISGWRRRRPEDTLVLAGPSFGHKPALGETAYDHRRTRLRPHGVSVAVELATIARRVDADVIVAHNFVPIFSNVPSVVFVHDVLFQSNPEWFSRSERLYFRGIAKLLNRASAITTSSRSEADRIVFENSKIRHVSPIGLALATELADVVATRPQGLSGRSGFALSVGRLNRRKNLESVLRAAMRSRRVTADRPLVVVGQSDGASPELESAITDAIAHGTVLFLGHVSDGELRWLYEHADALLFMSRGEGFGLPPVEATAFGCPLIVSDIAVFRETVGDVATFVPLDEDAALIAAIDQIRDREVIGSRVSIDWAEDRWDQIADRLIGVVRRVLSDAS